MHRVIFRHGGVARGGIVLAASMASIALAGCAQLPRDANGVPPTARLAPDALPERPLSPEARRRLDDLNQQVLRDQAAAFAMRQQYEGYARAASYAASNVSFYGGWGGWGGGYGGVGVGLPIYRGFPY